MKNRNKIFSKANLYETIWNEEYLGDDSSFKSHLSFIMGRQNLSRVNKHV
jgi:DNA-binding response OmpR family regulator